MTSQKKVSLDGWVRDDEDSRDYFRAAPSRAEAKHLPKIVDLSPRTAPIWDQGAQGSCVGHAVARAIDSERRQQRLPYGERVAPALVYWLARKLQGDAKKDSGTSIRNGFKGAGQTGYVLEPDFPYNPKIFARAPSNEVMTKAGKNRLAAYHRVEQTHDAIRAALAAGDVVVYGFDVPKTFEISKTTGLWIFDHDGPFEGGHAMALTGYDDTKGHFTEQNSWGNRWGLKGTSRKSYDFILSRRCADFWVCSKVAA